MKKLWIKCLKVLESLQWLPLLLLRLILAYGFYAPAMEKLKNFSTVAQWFASLSIPFPYQSVLLVTTIEIAGVILLSLGLFTRLVSIPLIFSMLVAIFTVHWSHGFSASASGIEIPLYYVAMLLTLLVFGPGSVSVDSIVNLKKNQRRKT